MKKIFYWFAVSCLMMLGSCQAETDWNGIYRYEQTLAASAGGSPVVMIYQLALQNQSCWLDITGFQTDEKIKCQVQTQANQASIQFVSYADGKISNAFGVQLYNPQQPLFYLTRNKIELLTRWDKLQPDEIKILTGKYFIKQK